MKSITRRQFMKLSAAFAAMMGLESSSFSRIADALEALSSGRAPVLWLQGQSCSGCSVSLLNSESPGPAELLTDYFSLLFHSTLSTATGHTGMDVIEATIRNKGFYLVVEGSIPSSMPEACLLGGKPVAGYILEAAKSCEGIIAAGSCASYGGIPSSENNVTGAVSAGEFLKNNGVAKPVISIPGCPAHPDWIVGTIVHLLKFGVPELDGWGRPKMFYSRLIHDLCPRFPDYEREHFASHFSDEGCLFKLGCLGVKTHADCMTRMWNGGANVCINAGAPCVGCAWEEFSKKASFPFYRKNEGQS